MKKPTPTELGEGYDALAEALDQLWGVNLHHGYWNDASDGASFEEAANRLTDKLSGLLTIKPGDRLLDLGCGIGEPAIRLAAAHDIEIVGVSVSKRQVRRAADRAAAAGLAGRLSFQFADAMDLPLPDESFDLVWALESMHHMPDRWHVLRHAARVLRPGGRIAIGDFLLVPDDDGQDGDAARLFEASGGVLTIVGLDEYLSHVRAAGLIPEATEDVSRHTRPSWGKAAVRFEAMRDIAEPHIGKEMCDLILSRYRLFSREASVGYVLLTARKPA